jgi:hypothetical protein
MWGIYSNPDPHGALPLVHTIHNLKSHGVWAVRDIQIIVSHGVNWMRYIFSSGWEHLSPNTIILHSFILHSLLLIVLFTMHISYKNLFLLNKQEVCELMLTGNTPALMWIYYSHVITLYGQTKDKQEAAIRFVQKWISSGGMLNQRVC